MSITRHIPNTITSMNLLCGVIGVVFACDGRADVAFPLMLVASVCDFCDGLSARLLGAYSPKGKELDSLSDLVSFGVLPAVMLRSTMQSCTWYDGALSLVPLLVAVFSGLRLAQFNVDERQHSSFIGLATPVAALMCASMCYYVACEPLGLLSDLCSAMWFIPAHSVVVCALLVCGMPMFSMKFSKGDPKSLKIKRISFVVETAALVAFVFLMGWNWSLAVTLACLMYILKNTIYALFRVR